MQKYPMLKQSLRPTLYLLVSILIGITVTLVMDSFANIAVEKKIRRELKQEIEAAATSFKEAYKTTTPDEVLFFLRKFSSSSLSDKIVAIDPNDEEKWIAEISLTFLPIRKETVISIITC